MHYFRWWRGGRTEEALGPIETLRPRYGTPHCEFPGCTKPHAANGFCSMHSARLERHGDPSIVKSVTYHYGPDNWGWVGDAAGYGAIHQRLRDVRGPASSFRCQCGQQAQQWAYQHTDPNEKISKEGPYSTDLAHYQPMCVSCHKTMDMAHLAAVR